MEDIVFMGIQPKFFLWKYSLGIVMKFPANFQFFQFFNLDWDWEFDNIHTWLVVVLVDYYKMGQQ